MKSNHLSFNFKLFKEEYKKYIWLLLITIFGIGLFKIVVPILFIKNILSTGTLLSSSNMYLSVENIIGNNIFIIFIALLSGINMFSYLHRKKDTDFYHSLPITRGKLFIIKYVLGLAIVIPVIVLIQFLYFVLLIFLKGEIISLKCVLGFLGIDIIFFSVIYSITILSSILSGGKLVSLVVSLNIINILTILSVGFNIIRETIDNYVFIGYGKLNILFSPIISYLNIFDIEKFNTSIQEVVITNIIVFLIVTILSFILFKNRKSESYSKVISFKTFHMIFKYYIIILFTIFSGLILLSISKLEVLMYVGVVLGGIIFYIVFQIIFDRKMKMEFKNLLGLFINVVVGVLILIGVKAYAVYESKYIPKASQVNSVNVNFFGYSTLRGDIYDKEVIEELINIQKEFINNIDKIHKSNPKNVRISYNLYDGKEILATILLDENNEKINNSIYKIITNKEYLKINFPFLYDDKYKNHIERIYILGGKEIFDRRDNLGDLSILEYLKNDIEEGLKYKINVNNIDNGINIRVEAGGEVFNIYVEKGTRVFEYLLDKFYV